MENEKLDKEICNLQFAISNKRGFTLIELIMVIVLLGIVAATAVMVIGNIVTQQQFDATVKEMNELKMAMLGNPDLVQSGARTSFAFAGDIGGLPAGNSLQPLVVQGALPNWTTTTAYHAATYPAEPAMPDLGTGAGWRGPYIDNKRDDSGTYLATLDGWGNAYSYQTATGQVTSTGGGTGNIVIPETSVAGLITGGIAGTLRGNQGNPIEGATVRIYYPNGSGIHTTAQTTTVADGTYSFANIPIGRRTIRVISGTSPNWAIINDTVVVEGGQTVSKNLTIADMVAPNAPDWATIPGDCNKTGGYALNTSQINLQWTASTSPDVASYRLYRNGAIYQTGLTGTAYTDNAIASNTRYTYGISAVDTAGNESGTNATGDIIAGPIYKRDNSSFPIPNQVRIRTRNRGLNNIIMTAGIYRMRVTWTGGSATAVTLVSIGGNIIYSGSASSGTDFAITAGYTYNCNNNQDIDITFDNSINTATSMTADIGGTYPTGPFDGTLTGIPLTAGIP